MHTEFTAKCKHVPAPFWSLFVVLAIGCQAAEANSTYVDACRSLGLCDEPSQPPLLIDVLCDASVGGPCARDSLNKTMQAALREASSRPGSRVRLWMLQKTVADTTVVGEQLVPPARRGSTRTKHAVADRFVSSAAEFFVTVSAPVLDAAPIRRSALAEALSKIALADSAGLTRLLVVITDGREVTSFHDFECGTLPAETKFLASLRKRELLTPGSLTGTLVHFAFMQSAPIPARGCAVQIDRERRIRTLWTAALKTAGASEVRMASGTPTFESVKNENDHQQKEEK